jgi:hypothetical protein
LQDLQADIVVIQLAVTKRNVNIESQVLSVLQQQALIDVGGFLIVTGQSQGEV